MDIRLEVRKLLVDPILRGDFSTAVDDFVLDTADGAVPLGASLRCDLESEGIRIEMREHGTRLFWRDFRAGTKFGISDTLTGEGTVGGKLKIRISGIWPAPSISEYSRGDVVVSTATAAANRIEVPATGLDSLSKDEIDQVLRRANSGDGKTLVGSVPSEESETTAFGHLALFASTELTFRNQVSKWTEEHEFWGKRSGSKYASWDGVVLGGAYSLIQDGEHLKVGFRNPAVDAEDARKRARALFAAVGFALGIQPWPSYLKVTENGRVLEEWVQCVQQVQGKMVPFWSRHGFEYPEAPTQLIACVAEWVYSLPSVEHNRFVHALWVFRSADHDKVPMPVKLAMTGAVIEGLFDAAKIGEAPERFVELRDEAVAWAERIQFTGSDPERSAFSKRLQGYLARWPYEDRRVTWQSTFGALFPGREDWLNQLYKLYGECRHSSAHGDFAAAMAGDPHALTEKLGRLAGFANLIVAAKAGYEGPLLESPLSGSMIELGESSPPFSPGEFPAGSTSDRAHAETEPSPTHRPLFEYDEELLEKLRKIPFERQDAVGDPPKSWAVEMGLEVGDYNLPDESLTRARVREICRDEEVDVLYGYLCAMAWGAQGRGQGGAKPVRKAWKHRKRLAKVLKELRKPGLNRADAYDLFTGEGLIPGLGPAYFTKLLYFFCPAEPADRYVMDQWTTKPVVLLTGQKLIKHSDAGPTRQNTGLNYELFCRVIDDLAALLGEASGELMEERLFSVGSIRRAPRGAWRQVVVDAWEKRSTLPRYDEGVVSKLIESTEKPNPEGDSNRTC